MNLTKDELRIQATRAAITERRSPLPAPSEEAQTSDSPEGDGICYICKLPKNSPGAEYCSAAHGTIPMPAEDFAKWAKSRAHADLFAPSEDVFLPECTIDLNTGEFIEPSAGSEAGTVDRKSVV